MFLLELQFGDKWVTLPPVYKTRDDAHWAAAKWRSKFGRSTNDGDPFRVVPAPSEELIEAAK